MSFQFTKFEELLSIVKKFGVVYFNSTRIKTFEINEGLDLDVSELYQTNNKEYFLIFEDGSIRRPVIYIVDISSWRENWGLP